MAEVERLEELSRQLKTHYLWAILAVGIPGNLISLFTFLRMRSLGSCVVYVAVLAVVDSLALLEKLALTLLQQHQVPFSPQSCKALLFSANTLVIYANWIVVALAAERLFAVFRPLALSVYWTRSRAAGALILLLVCLLVCVPVIVVSTPRNDTLSCVYASQHQATADVWHWVNVSMYGFLPCSLLLCMNTAILWLLRRARRKHLQLCQGRAGTRGSPQRVRADSQKQASFILLLASFVLILLTTPRCVMLLLQQLWQPHEAVVVARVRVLNQVTYALADINHAINFFLYFVSARQFRRRFRELFRFNPNSLRRLPTRETVQHRICDCESVRFVMTATKNSRSPVLESDGGGDNDDGGSSGRERTHVEGWQEMKLRTDMF